MARIRNETQASGLYSLEAALPARKMKMAQAFKVK